MPYGMTGSSYAAGDYYRGDYYQGDPGFLGSLFKGVTGAIGGFISGGPVGAIIGGARGITSKGPPGPTGQGMNLVQRPQITPPVPGFQPGVGIQTPDFRFGAFGPAKVDVGGGPGTALAPIHHGRLNRSNYVTRGGGTSHWPQALILHPKGTVEVKSRRMNVGNGRALKRALRRARGFERLARSVMIVHRFKRKATRRSRK